MYGFISASFGRGFNNVGERSSQIIAFALMCFPLNFLNVRLSFATTGLRGSIRTEFISFYAPSSARLRRKLTAAIFVAQIGEPPNVGQVYSETDNREQEIDFLAPGLPVIRRRLSFHRSWRILHGFVAFKRLRWRSPVLERTSLLY